MAQTRVRSTPTRRTFAIHVFDILLWGSAALCGVQMWNVLTGIPIGGEANGFWISPTALPQVQFYEYLLTEDTRPDRMLVTAIPLWVRAVGCLSIALATIMFMLLVRGARLIAVRATQGRPFAPDVAPGLRTTAWRVVALAVLRALVDVVVIWGLHNSKPEQFYSVSVGTGGPALSPSLVLAAIVAGVLATAFARGTQLERETDGLV